MPTVEDTRIDEIGKIILDHRYEKDPRDMNALKYSSYLIAKKILEYMAPELEKARILNDKIGHLVATDIAVLVEKARKWDRVKEIADSRPPCKCPLWKEDACNLEYGGCIFRDVVEALDALTEKEANNAR